MRILHTSWGGRAEHDILEIHMDIDDVKITLSLHNQNYNDWGHGNQLSFEQFKTKSYDMCDGTLSKNFLYECIMDLVEKECGLNYFKIREEDIEFP